MLREAARVAAYLEAQGVACAVIGGVALAAHGIARATLDVDILVADARVLETEFWAGLAAIPPPEVRRGDADDPLLGVVRFMTHALAIDVVVGRPPLAGRVVARRMLVDVAAGRLPFADRGDLVLLKLLAAGPQDLVDIELLLAADPALRTIVEERLSEAPPQVRATWDTRFRAR
jgi:hypothetical protein